METVFEMLQRQFPVRNSDAQKQAFAQWTLEKAREAGWDAEIEENGKHRNIVIGNTEQAKVIFTAHYDTPRSALLPNLMLPCSRGLFWLYQITYALPPVAAALGAAALVFRFVPLDYQNPLCRLLPLLAYLAVFLLLFRILIMGKSNPHNANDNTSGVAAVLSVMEALPEDERGKAALILFDNEEKGKLGSKAYARAHQALCSKTPVINFDCVGWGDHFVCIAARAFQKKPEYTLFEQAFSALPHCGFFSDRQASANSDQKNFPLGTAVVCCRKSKMGILYTNYIHTKKDTDVDQQNITRICTAASETVKLFVQ